MKNKENLLKAIRDAEEAVKEAELICKKTEQTTEDILVAVENEIFKGVEELKSTAEGEQVLINTLEILEVWWQANKAEVCAEEALLEKQAALRQLLGK